MLAPARAMSLRKLPVASTRSGTAVARQNRLALHQHQMQADAQPRHAFAPGRTASVAAAPDTIRLAAVRMPSDGRVPPLVDFAAAPKSSAVTMRFFTDNPNVMARDVRASQAMTGHVTDLRCAYFCQVRDVPTGWPTFGGP